MALAKLEGQIGNLQVDDQPTNRKAALAAKGLEPKIKALEELQSETDKLLETYEEERRKLAEKLLSDMLPLHAKRRAIVNGEDSTEPKATKELEQSLEKNDAPSSEETEEPKDTTKKPDDSTASTTETVSKGVPSFWLHAMQHNDDCAALIAPWDEDVLEYLTDIEWVHLEECKGFAIHFHFAPNPYFTNRVLKKTIPLNKMYGLGGADPIIDEVQGTQIDWKSGQNVTVEMSKPKKGGRRGGRGAKSTKPKLVPRNSFFNFFKELDFDSIDPEEAEEVQYMMQAEMDMAMAIKEQLVPNAIRWYTGEASEDSDDEDYLEEEEEASDEDEDDDDEAPELSSDSDEADENVRDAIAKAFGNNNATSSDVTTQGENQTERPPECKQQ